MSGSSSKVECSTTNPFTRLRVSVDELGQTVVEWDLSSKMRDCGPYEFYLEFARAEMESTWEAVNDSPVVDAFSMILDSTVRRHAMNNRSVYRIRLETPRAIYYSNAEYPFGVLEASQWKLAQELVRKEGVDKRPQFGGTPGYLLKRRVFGPKCTVCVDQNTGQVIDVHCQYCLGTGITGGYFAPVSYPVKFLSSESYNVEITPVGTMDPHEIEARLLPFPFPTRNDVWYELNTGRAFVISGIKVVSKLQSFPIALTGKLALAASTDPIYFLINS